MCDYTIGVEKTLTGLDNFYMAGQWVEPGESVPFVAISGCNIIQQICHEDKKEFKADAPTHEKVKVSYTSANAIN